MTKDPVGQMSGGVTTTYRQTNDAAVQVLQAERGDALAYLQRRGLADGDGSVAEILGLIDSTRRRKPRPVSVATRPLLVKICPECQTEFTPSSPSTQCCSRACAGRLGNSKRTGRQQAPRRNP